jgi:acetyl-CoA carboxylase biotin carboxyl carrier protein
MELKTIQQLVQLMRRGDVQELEIDDPATGLRVRLKRGGDAPLAGPAAPVVHVTHGGPALAAPTLMAHSTAAPAAESPAAAPAGKPFLSPMVGTFYRASSPEAEPFVSVGSEVKAETVLCIIEAMKVMNEIKAETSGRILEVLVENGEPVEFGQPLFLLAER